MAGMKSLNIEKLMGHSLGVSTNSYYRATTSDEILRDYLKAVPFLAISSQIRLQRQMEQVVEQSRNDNAKINYRKR